MRVVICGGGVIGACTAYFLARRGVDVSVVERADVAAAASGKAGTDFSESPQRSESLKISGAESCG